jgi:PAS domain S-box-containing protein
MSSQTAIFQDLLEAMPDALIGVDSLGVIRFVNRQAESLFGYERNELVRARVQMQVPESVRKIHMGQEEWLSQVAPGPAGRHRPELAGRRADGTQFPVDISLSSMDTTDGVVVIAAVRDMTERGRANKESEQLGRLLAVVEFSGEAIISTTVDGNINSWNPAAESLMRGSSRQEIVRKPGSLLIPQDQTEQLPAVLDKIRVNQCIEHLQTVRVRKDAATFPALLTLSPIRDKDGTVIGAWTITRDITKQKEAHELSRSMIEASLD